MSKGTWNKPSQGVIHGYSEEGRPRGTGGNKVLLASQMLTNIQHL